MRHNTDVMECNVASLAHPPKCHSEGQTAMGMTGGYKR